MRRRSLHICPDPLADFIYPLTVFDFFNNINQFYGVITEFCTVQNNPTMSAGVGLDYTWVDQNRKQVKLPAPQYIDYVMTWVGGLLSDEATFPTKAGECCGLIYSCLKCD